MRTLALSTEPRALDVRCTNTELWVSLEDGREVTVPLAWYPRLQDATPEQRSHWRLIGRGTGISWEDLDEDLSVHGLLEGGPTQEAKYHARVAHFEALAEHAAVRQVSSTEDRLNVTLTDGRTISVPLAYFAGLFDAPHSVRQNYQLLDVGHTICWPDAGESVTLDSLLEAGTGD